MRVEHRCLLFYRAERVADDDGFRLAVFRSKVFGQDEIARDVDAVGVLEAHELDGDFVAVVEVGVAGGEGHGLLLCFCGCGKSECGHEGGGDECTVHGFSAWVDVFTAVQVGHLCPTYVCAAWRNFQFDIR